MALYVTKSSGKLEEVDYTKVERVLLWASEGLSVDYREIFNPDTYSSFFYNEVSTGTIQSLLANQAATKVKENSDWDSVAARLILQTIRKQAHDGDTDYLPFQDYLDNVKENGQVKLQDALYSFDLVKIDRAIEPLADLYFSYLGIKTLADRYLIKDTNGRILEAPQHFLMRVAMGLSIGEKNPTETAIKFYTQYSELKVLSSTPTLFNSGTTHPQLSSCYVSRIKEDSLEGIFATAQENAQCSKFAGGTAVSLTPIRSKGSPIKSTGGKSSGVIPYAKLLEQTMRSFDQGGKRLGVAALYLEPWHKDIFDFLSSIDPSKDERVALRDVFLATWLNDIFMRRVEADEQWTLLCPNDCPELHSLWGEEFDKKYLEYEETIPAEKKKVVQARGVWAAIIECLYNNKGNGWPCFKDTINKRSMTKGYGVVHSSNLCTEITLRNSADRNSVCNLASVNLSTISTVDELEKAVRTGVRMIDNAITNGFIPIESGKSFNEEDRPLGLGVMGYTEFLADQGIPYESWEHVHAADTLFRYIAYVATDESNKLGREKGNFPMFDKSEWAKGHLPYDTGLVPELERNLTENAVELPEIFKQMGREATDEKWQELRTRTTKNMRNSCLLSIAPTATIANIFGTTSCIELPLLNVYQKSNLSGDFTYVSPLYRKHKGNKDLVKTAREVDSDWFLLAAAVRQKWVDQSQSLNVYVTSETTGKELSEIYIKGWKLGIKTFYYLKSEAEDERKARQNFWTEKEEPLVCSTDDSCQVCQ